MIVNEDSGNQSNYVQILTLNIYNSASYSINDNWPRLATFVGCGDRAKVEFQAKKHGAPIPSSGPAHVPIPKPSAGARQLEPKPR